MLSKAGNTYDVSQNSQFVMPLEFGKQSAWCLSNSNQVVRVCPQNTHIIIGFMGLKWRKWHFFMWMNTGIKSFVKSIYTDKWYFPTSNDFTKKMLYHSHRIQRLCYRHFILFSVVVQTFHCCDQMNGNYFQDLQSSQIHIDSQKQLHVAYVIQ